MFGKSKTDVLIAGAGPVGMLAALELSQHGIAVEIVDEQWQTTSGSYALALHSQTLELLDELGLAQDLVERGQQLTVLRLLDPDGRERAAIDLAKVSSRFPFVLSLPQSDFESCLETAINERKASGKLDVRWNHRLVGLHADGDGVSVTVHRLGKESSGYGVMKMETVVEKELTTRARYVIGADGHRSRVRRSLGASFEPTHEAQPFAVFQLHGDHRCGDEMKVVLGDETISALWPMAPDWCRWSFEHSEAEMLSKRKKNRLAVQIGSASYPHLPDHELDQLLASRASWFKLAERSIEWSAAMRFERCLVDTFGSERIWLAGDAAHLAEPVGIRSMNVGLREAHQLSSILAGLVLGKGSQSALDEYGEQRMSEWRQLLSQGPRATTTADTDAWVSDHAEQIISSIPASGDALASLAAQVGLEMV